MQGLGEFVLLFASHTLNDVDTVVSNYVLVQPVSSTYSIVDPSLAVWKLSLLLSLYLLTFMIGRETATHLDSF